MAPSRKKGSGRASAAAAAARRQWKVGDLVLAKVKGFPAWPATVSEPEKWGYRVDRKKVLVYFFGTQQIAFCNPADVEEFTEEKKESLLGKRHGKGADFVRAAHEIIESYEKLKKRDRIGDINSVDEVTATNAVNSLAEFALKGQIETPSVMINSRLKKPHSGGDENEPNLPNGDIADTMQADALCDMDTSSDDPIDNLVVTRKPLADSFSSKRRIQGLQQQGSASHIKGSFALRSRTSSRVDISRFQKLVLPSSNGNRASGDVPAKVAQDRSVRRSKRIRKSPDVHEGQGTGSPAFLSNGSIEENGSKIVTVDFDTFSLTEGFTLESGCKLLQPESIIQGSEGEVELSQMLDLQTSAVVVKKKRKPNRKRVTSDAPETVARLSSKAGSEVELHRSGQISPNSHEKLGESCLKEDGDEHLPLVKRARVRMGRSSSAGKELGTSIQPEEKLLRSRQVPISFNCEEDGPADKDLFLVKGATENSSLQTKCSQSSVTNSMVWTVKKNQQYGCSVDGEAALPPSKRLHRALEAMSANAAEDGQTEVLSSIKTLVNGGCISPTRDSPDKSTDSGAGNHSGGQNVEVLCNNTSQDGSSDFSTSSDSGVAKECEKPLVEVSMCDEPGEDIRAETVDLSDSRGPSVSSSGTQTAEVVVANQSPKPLSSDPEEEQACLGCNQGSPAKMLNLMDKCRSENPESIDNNSEKPLSELDASEHSGMSLDPVLRTGNGNCSPQNDTNLLLCSREGNCPGATELSNLSLHANSQVEMREVVKEIKQTQKDSNDTIPTSVKVMSAAAADGPSNLSHSASPSDDHLDNKDATDTRSSSSPTDGLDSPARMSQTNTSICNAFTAENDKTPQNNGCCSPDVHLHHVKSKNVGKCNNKSTAALASFQDVLGTLTRTKESIGRATRSALYCSRFGIAAKVVEVLVRNLECESSLHRRVDLFFLVDSIIQCSRGLKGDVGQIYRSAIQAVLPRLVLAAAPPGSHALENRRQCLKVLKLWLERRVFQDSIIRQHIRDLESLNSSSSSGAFSRRPLRTERAFDDPIRQMEGMHVDEYGSNSSLQLPGFRMPPMLRDEDEGSDSDGGSFEAVTPEHKCETPEEQERVPIPATIGKHRHVLEDVDGELEMEDVAPTCEADASSTCNAGNNPAQTMHPQFERHFPLSFAPPLPADVPPPPPPLPASPPPPPSLPPVPHMPAPIYNCLDSEVHDIRENLQQSMVQQPVALRINLITSDAVCCQVPESRDVLDVRMQTQLSNSASSCSFSSLPVSHPPIPPSNIAQQTDHATLLNKAYHLPPPQPAPSNQFSYVQADQRVQSLRDVPPPPYPNRDHFVQGTDGNFYTDHDRMKPGPHELGDSWRFPGASFSGTYYPDTPRGPYPPAPYAGPPCEPPPPNHRWGFQPRAMNHREFVPHRPPSEGPVPVAIRAPGFWRPR